MANAVKIERWPDFNGEPASSFERDDGRRYVLFGKDIDESTPEAIPTSRLRRTRIGYQLFGGKAVLLGILASEKDRGNGMGEKLIEYFLEHIADLEAEFVCTARIHKPVVCLQLARVGLTAEQQDFRAMLLPRSNYDETPNIPKITVLEDSVEDRSRIVPRVDSNTFYREVHPMEALYRYPAGGHEISLHTSYAEK